MNNTKKKLLPLIIGASLLGLSAPSSAVVPITDYTQLGQSITDDVAELLYHDLWTTIADSMMEQATSMASLTIDNTNNMWANAVVRQGAAYEEIQNIEVTKMVMPAFNTVKTLGLSVSLYCNEGSEVYEKESDDKNYVSEQMAAVIENEGGTATTFSDTQDEIVERFNGGDGVCSNLSTTTTESAINPKPLISDTADEESLSEDAEQAIYDYIDLVAPPYVPLYLDKSRAISGNTTLKVKNTELEALQSFPRVMLLKLMSKRSVTNSETGLSEITTLDEFGEQHYGKGTSSTENISGQIMLSNLAVPSVIWRNLAVMKAFQVHMSVLKYKAALDNEAIKAIDLAFELRKERLGKDAEIDLSE
ncbi:hypothetical protein [Psychromonas sp. SP041]|uniref:hypothetical protein n=1 Tax=Psychromonas sp. SP041 TaxID=1365007 RepID=UPI0010C7D93C|nr:hypothetical protein [Psychromonas sp. SP041]